MHSRVVTRQFSKKNTSTSTPPERSSLGAHQSYHLNCNTLTVYLHRRSHSNGSLQYGGNAIAIPIAQANGSEDAMGGRAKKGAGRKTSTRIPVLAPPSSGTFCTPLRCVSCAKNPRLKKTEALWRGPEMFQEGAFSGTSSSPIRFAPPHIMQSGTGKIMEISLWVRGWE